MNQTPQNSVTVFYCFVNCFFTVFNCCFSDVPLHRLMFPTGLPFFLYVPVRGNCCFLCSRSNYCFFAVFQCCFLCSRLKYCFFYCLFNVFSVFFRLVLAGTQTTENSNLRFKTVKQTVKNSYSIGNIVPDCVLAGTISRNSEHRLIFRTRWWNMF